MIQCASTSVCQHHLILMLSTEMKYHGVEGGMPTSNEDAVTKSGSTGVRVDNMAGSPRVPQSCQTPNMDGSH